MMQQTLLACSMVIVLVSGQRYSKSIETQPKFGYSSTIMHSGPNVKDVEYEPQYIHRRDPNNENLFNVGYDLKFKDDNNGKLNNKKYTQVNTNRKFENAEVITGRIKKNEKVRAPNINSDLSPKDFVSNALLKQQILTSVRHVAPKYPSQSPTFTYNTQQNIFKDVVKATRPESIQLTPELKTSYNIYNNKESRKKVEPLVMHDYSRYYPQAPELKYSEMKAANFDHNIALKNSEPFDFSNAHGEITFGDNKNSDDALTASSEQYNQKQSTTDDNNKNLDYRQDLRNLNIQAHLPKNLQGVRALPVDTSLLKDAVLTTNLQQPAKYSRVIPIHFDVRPIQEAMQKELGKYKHNYGYQPQQQNYLASATSDGERGLTYEDYKPSPSETNYRIYGKAAPVDQNQYKVGHSYGKENANYEEDIYKIVSMRPPPVAQNLRY